MLLGYTSNKSIKINAIWLNDTERHLNKCYLLIRQIQALK